MTDQKMKNAVNDGAQEAAAATGRYNWDKQRAMELYNKGLSDVAIGTALGVTGTTIGNWRKKTGLPVNAIAPGGKKDAAPVKIDPQRLAESAKHVLYPEPPETDLPQHTTGKPEMAVISHELSPDWMQKADDVIAGIAQRLRRDPALVPAGNPDLMRAVELTFDLLGKIWARI